jgi:hypothetical protein
LAGVIGLSIAGPWYVLHRDTLLHFLRTNGWLAARLEEELHVLILPNLPHFEAQAFRYEVQRNQLPLTITFITGIVETDNEQIMNEAEYVVAKSGELGPTWTLQHAPDYSKELLRSDIGIGKHTLLDTYSLPDGSTAFLYRKDAR